MERMTEKVIRIEGIDPAELYGVAGSNIDRIGGKFPKLKMVARGSSIKVTGEAGEIERFDRKLSQLIEYYGRYGHVSPQVIDQVYDGGMPRGDGDLPEPQDVIVHGNAGLVVRARTVNQQRLLRLSERNDLLFAVGPAGSGKTYTAIALAVRALRNREVKRIILTRPAVEAGEKLGFLPGDMKEKLDPYLQPLYDALNDMIPAEARPLHGGRDGADRSARVHARPHARQRLRDSGRSAEHDRLAAQDVPYAYGAQRALHRDGRRDADRTAAS